MPVRPIYLNHAGTWPLDPAPRRRILDLLHEDPADPAGLLSDGRRLGREIDAAREAVAAFLGAAPGEIVFTGSGTEACNLALKGVALARGARAGRVVVGATERSAVAYPARTLARLGVEVREAPVRPDGRVDLDALGELARGAALLSFAYADEETGTCQPLQAIARIAREAGALLHVDACVAAGYRPIDARALGADLLSLSAHRIGGPRGAGALRVREGVRLMPLIEGGVWEGGRRGGMPFIAGIAGFAAAASLRAAALPEDGPRMDRIGRRIETALLAIGGAALNGHPEDRLRALVNVSLEGAEGEALLLKLARRGVIAASGSPCADAAGLPSRVLTAMGLSEARARSSVLLSAGPSTTEEEADRAAAAVAESAAELRAVLHGRPE